MKIDKNQIKQWRNFCEKSSYGDGTSYKALTQTMFVPLLDEIEKLHTALEYYASREHEADNEDGEIARKALGIE